MGQITAVDSNTLVFLQHMVIHYCYQLCYIKENLSCCTNKSKWYIDFNSTVSSGADQRKHQSSASLALWGEFNGDRWSPRTQRANNAENVSIWWRHHDLCSAYFLLGCLCGRMSNSHTANIIKPQIINYVKNVHFLNCLNRNSFHWDFLKKIKI